MARSERPVRCAVSAVKRFHSRSFSLLLGLQPADHATMRHEIKLTSESGEDMRPTIDAFSASVGLDHVAPARFSVLLALQLYAGFESDQLHPARIVGEIRALEGLGRASSTKPPIQNKHPPLKGLWHKHYLPHGLAALALNLQNAQRKHGIPLAEEYAREAERSGAERILTAEDIKAISHDAAYGNFMRRAAASEITGEWIVFAEHEGRKYYLILATHRKEDHAETRRYIDAICCKEFPFLVSLLEGN